MKINLSESVSDLHYFGNSMIVTIEGEEYILNATKSFICKRLLFHSDPIRLIDELIGENNSTNEEKDILKQNVDAFIHGTDLGKKLFTMEGIPDEKHVRITGIPEQYYPLKVDLELTNKCNLYCLHCYKRANEGNINTLEKDKVFDFLEENRGRISTVHITGGEPLLVPYFEELITHFSDSYYFDLSSNGLLVHQLSPETIAKLRNISLTLYGLDDEDYANFTGNKHGYSSLIKSCNHLKNYNKPYKINVVLNSDVFNRLEQYIEQAISMGASIFHIGKTSAIGRLSEQRDHEDWKLTKEELNQAYRLIRLMEKKYFNLIKVLPWEREVYYAASSYTDEMESIYPEGCLACGAGNRTWGISESFEFTPCIMYQNLFQMSHSNWESYVVGDYPLSWKEIVSDFNHNCEKNKMDTCRRLTMFSGRAL